MSLRELLNINPAVLEGATCATIPPTEADPLFFPPSGGAGPKNTKAAKALCGVCPVREECLKDALAEEADAEDALRWGIRGGLTAKERAELVGWIPGRRRGGVGGTGPQPINHGTNSGAVTHRTRGEEVCPACREARREYERGRRAKAKKAKADAA